MGSFLEIDGSEGEGGGQVLRSSLTLSILTQRPFRLNNIRARRSKPGLAAQHLACVRAAAAICKGHYKGGSIGSSTLYFEPGTVASGNYSFSIGTAGATSLVLQTVALPLMLKGTSPSRVSITGGTHVSHSPCYHFLETTWAGYLAKLGLKLELEMTRPGFYPRGGGEIVTTIHPANLIKSLLLTVRSTITTAGGFSAVAGLPGSINKRQARRLSFKLSQASLESHIQELVWENGPSTVAAAILNSSPARTLVFGLGERGKPAEAVADEAAAQAIAYLESGACVDSHSADQIILPLAIAKEASEYSVSEVTLHLLTNIDIIRKFVDREITCEGELGKVGVVRVAAA